MMPTAPGSSARATGGDRKPTVLVCLLLAAVVVAVYAPVVTLQFVNYDDPDYVVSNPHVQGGVSVAGLKWAFGRVHGTATYWHPLTWVSHMLDSQMFGLKPAGHHMVNLLFHALNTMLVFLVFQRLTGAFWRSALLAGLFGLHPLQVDTVAWVAERKNLLSAVFWLLTMWAYAGYAQRETKSHGRWRWYGAALLFFALGLMCKPVLVTLPCVLLLLDYWPLGRLAFPSVRQSPVPPLRLLLEKVPFFGLAAASCVITLLAHQGLRLLQEGFSLPLALRAENAAVSYARYLGKAMWPVNLTVLYPLPLGRWTTEAVVASALLLVAVSALAVRLAKARPWLLVGWFWFLGVLVPFIGLVQAGAQAMAERFMYVPLIGLALVVVWGVADLTRRWKQRPVPLSMGAALALCVFALVAGRQLLYWQNTETLFRRVLAVTRDNYVAYDTLGLYFAQLGQLNLARKCHEESLRIAPGSLPPQRNLAAVLVRQKKYVEACALFEEALRADPESAEAHNNLGMALSWLGRTREAAGHLREATRLSPDNASTHHNLGLALLDLGQLEDAAGAFAAAVRLKPQDLEARCRLAGALLGQGKGAEAVQQYRAALKLAPESPEALNNLAWILAANADPALRNGSEAVQLAERACKVTDYRQPQLVGTLAAAYAEAGRFNEAVTTAEKAVQLAEQCGQPELAARNKALAERYRSGQPARDAS